MTPGFALFARRVVAGFGLAMGALLVGVDAQAQGPLPGEYRISSRSSGKCLDAERGSRIAGSRVQEWDCHGGLNQRFRLIRIGDAWVVRVMHSDLCLSVARRGNLVQADCSGDANQFFYFLPNARGDYRIEQDGRCLEVRETDSLTAAELDPDAFRVSLNSCAAEPVIPQSWDLW